jgi:hypothetical protein
MKYFTRELIERYGSPDEAVARAADAEWEATLRRYEEGLRSIEPELPEHILEFTRLLLHDAVVWSITRQGDKLLMVLRKDIPPRHMVLLTYTLTDEPVIDREALAPAHRGQVMDYQYDEFELIREGNRQTYSQSILFGNGWEMSLRFSDVQVSLADPVYPPPGAVFVPVSPPIAAQSA